MQTTDETKIQSYIANATEMQDGLIVIVGQGKLLVDMCVHRGFEKLINEFGNEYINEYSLFQITLIKRKPEYSNCDTFFNYSYMTNGSIEEFDVANERHEYYDDAQSAHARLAFIIACQNHF